MFIVNDLERVNELFKSGLISKSDYHKFLSGIANKNVLLKACETLPLADNAKAAIEKSHHMQFIKTNEGGLLQYKLQTDIRFSTQQNTGEKSKLEKATPSRRIQAPANAKAIQIKDIDSLEKAHTAGEITYDFYKGYKPVMQSLKSITDLAETLRKGGRS